MGIFSKLFGRKKKQEENQPANKKAARPTEPSDEVSLEEVNESLEEVNTIKKDEPKKETPKKKETPQKKPQHEPQEKKETPEDKTVYEIKKHSDGWQVIKEGSDKAHRVFSYQKEAIDFAKSEGLEYRVYKSDGTQRK